MLVFRHVDEAIADDPAPSTGGWF